MKRINNWFHFAVNRIVSHALMSFFVIAIGVIALFITNLFIVDSHLVEAGTADLKLVLASDLSRTYVLEPFMATSEDQFDEIALLEDISRIDGVYALGNFVNYAPDYVSDLDAEVTFMAMSDHAFDVCDLSKHLLKGTPPSELEEEDLANAVYLGYAFRSTPLYSEIERNDRTFVVQGILDSSARFIDIEEILENSFNLKYSYSFSLNGYMLARASEGTASSVSVLVLDKRCDAKETYQCVVDVIEAYGIESNRVLSPIQGTLDIKKQNNQNLTRRILPLLLLGMISTIVGFLTLQLFNIFSDQKEFGIMLANGFQKSDIMAILILENVIKLIIAAIPALLLLRIFAMNPERLRAILIIMTSIGGIWLLLVLLCILLFSSIIPFWMIKKKTMVELINGKW